MDRDRARFCAKFLGFDVVALEILWSVCQTPIGILMTAAVVDFILGDPWGWPHPVRLMGWIIQRYCQLVWKGLQHPMHLKIAGVFLGVGLTVGSGLITWLILQVSHSISQPLGWSLEVILLASCFAGKSLRKAAIDVLIPLKQGFLAEAKVTLSHCVGRDTEDLSTVGILRAVLETVAENTTDAVMAPLFYAIVGLFIPGVGPVPFAIAYKAVSTLDSEVGYHAEPYTHLGWFSAKLDDVLTWLPCRLNVLTLGSISGKLPAVWSLCKRDAIKDPSPNSGWSECAYAAILGVQLGGFNTYKGVVKFKPLLGKPYHPITPTTIEMALRLMRNSFITWLAIAAAIYSLTIH